MFETISSVERKGEFYIYDAGAFSPCYLHSDGRALSTREFFPSREDAQAVLDKFYPKQEHVWVHGDVFENVAGIQIYLEPFNGPIVVNLQHTKSSGTPDVQLPDSKFLFNIGEKI